MAMMGYAAPANWSNALAIMGAALKDASPGGNGDALAQTQNLLAQRSMMNARLGLMQRLGQMQGGQPVSTVDQVNAPEIGRNPAPMATTPAVSAGDPRWQEIATDADMLGMPLTSTLKMLELNQPHVTVTPSGEAINDKSAANIGRVFPGLDKGIVPQRGPNGELTGATAIPGYADAAASIAGATTGAQEQAKAPWTLVDVPTSDGSTVKMPLSIAASVLTKNFTQPAPSAAGGAPAGAAGSIPGQLGRTPSTAETELAKKRASTQGEREQLQPKEWGALQDLDNTSATTSQIIHQILGDVHDPKTGQWVAGAKPQANKWTTGAVGEMLHEVPGTPQHDLDQQLEHIRAMTSMEQLQNLRDNSPTGAGLGRVTQQEINLLAAMRGSIDQGQRLPQFQGNLRRQLGMLDQMIGNRRAVYQNTYGGIQQPTPGATAPIPPKGPQAQGPTREQLMAEARRRGLIK